MGINAIEAILVGNPHFHQLSGFSGLTNELHKARKVTRAHEVIPSWESTPKPQQPRSELAMEPRHTQSSPWHSSSPHKGATSPHCSHRITPLPHPAPPAVRQPFSWLRCGQRMRSRPLSLRLLRSPLQTPLQVPKGSDVHAVNASRHSQTPGF